MLPQELGGGTAESEEKLAEELSHGRETIGSQSEEMRQALTKLLKKSAEERAKANDQNCERIMHSKHGHGLFARESPHKKARGREKLEELCYQGQLPRRGDERRLLGYTYEVESDGVDTAV